MSLALFSVALLSHSIEGVLGYYLDSSCNCKCCKDNQEIRKSNDIHCGDCASCLHAESFLLSFFAPSSSCFRDEIVRGDFLNLAVLLDFDS